MCHVSPPQVFRVSEFAVRALAMTTKRGAAKCTLHEGHAFEHYCQVGG